jgi:putative phage-type endonuclease
VSTATLRRVTPTAVLALSATAGRTEWLEARKAGLGSSDMAAVMGVSAYGHSALRVYHEKKGNLPLENEPGEAAIWGNVLEEPVAREWARRNRTVVRRVGLVSHVDNAWMLCTLDRRCTECPLNAEEHEKCALEIKTRSAFVSSRWSKGVPDDVLAQALWQIAVTGLDHIHVMVLIGGNDPRQFTVRRSEHEKTIADIITVASRFWHENVLAGIAPPVVENDDPDDLIDLYGQLAGDRDGFVDLDADMSAYDDMRDYVVLGLEESAIGKQRKVIQARLIARLGGAEVAVMDGRAAYTYPKSTRRYVDMEDLAERHPDAYADCVRIGGKSGNDRRLNISSDFRKELA